MVLSVGVRAMVLEELPDGLESHVSDAWVGVAHELACASYHLRLKRSGKLSVLTNLNDLNDSVQACVRKFPPSSSCL